MILKTIVRSCFVVAIFLVADVPAMEIFSESFDGFTAPPANFNGLQFESGLPVAHTGDLPDWLKGGAGTVHAVNVAGPPPPPAAADFAVMIWQDNVITLSNPIAGSNNSGETYTLDFLASPAVYQAPAQVTTAADGLLVEVLRGDGTVLTSHTNMPGDWAGDIMMNPDSFQYVGDGSGDVVLRVGPSNSGSGHFGGAIDNLTLNGASEIFSADFDDFTAPDANFNGFQFESGLEVAFGGDLPAWGKSGAGVVHAVNRIEPLPPPPGDFAVMIWQDNVITLNSPISGSNDAGLTYTVDFDASPAVYQAPAQVTTEADGLLVEVLRGDDTVLASHTYLPGAWVGNIDLNSVSFDYVGDGSGDIRLRVAPSAFNSGHFGGAIDNLSVTVVPEPNSFTYLALIGLTLGWWRRKRS